MKKVMMIVLVAMLTGIVSAAPILYEDFTTNPSTENGTAGNLSLSNATVGVWYDTAAANYNLTDGTFRMTRPGGDGGFCSLNYVLDGTLLEAGQQYAVNINHTYATDGADRLGLDIWDVDFGAAGSVTAQVFRYWGGGDMGDLVTTNGATATELVDYAWWGGGALGIVSTNFTYDGSGDIMLRINASRPDNNWFRTDISSVEVVAIPEPGTLGMVAAFGGAIFFIRRRLMV